MTNKETVNRNIGLTFDFIREIIKDPKLLEQIPNNSVIEFVEKDFPKTEKKANGRLRRKYVLVKNEFEVM